MSDNEAYVSYLNDMNDRDFLDIAKKVASNSHCLRRQVGAVLITADQKYIITATNTPFPYATYCEKHGCLRNLYNIQSGTQLDICRCLHSEARIIALCSDRGIATAGATLYCTHYPCSSCARLLITAGITRIVYLNDYPDNRAKDLFNEMHLSVEKFQP